MKMRAAEAGAAGRIMDAGTPGARGVVAWAINLMVPLVLWRLVFQVGLGWSPLLSWLPALAAALLSLDLFGDRLLPSRTNEQAMRLLAIALGTQLLGLASLLLARQASMAGGMPSGMAMLLGAGVSFVVQYAIGQVVGHMTEVVFIRGRRLVSAQRARRAHKRATAEEDEVDEPHPVWAGEQLPARAAGTHLLAAGMTGSGKTTLIMALMRSVLPMVRRRSGFRAFVYDDKQDYYSVIHGLVGPSHLVTLNPLDARGLAWDIATDITLDTHAYEIAAILVPPEPQSQSPFFADAARLLVGQTMIALGVRAGQAWDFRDVLLACDSIATMREVLSVTPEGRRLCGSCFSNAKTGSDVLSTVHTKLGAYRPVAAGWAAANRRYSLRHWVQSQDVLVVSNDDTVRAVLNPINAVLVNRAAQLLLDLPDDGRSRTWMFFDELREGARFELVPTLLNKGRSRGLTLVLGFQTMDGLEVRYGEREAAEMAGECGCVAWLKLNTERSCEWASRAIGMVEQWEIRGRSGWRKFEVEAERVERPLVTPSQLRGLPLPAIAGRLQGWYVTPYTEPFHRSLTQVEVEALRPARAKDGQGRPIANYVRRTNQELKLQPWTIADLDRLKLPHSLLDVAPGTPSSGPAATAQPAAPVTAEAPSPPTGPSTVPPAPQAPEPPQAPKETPLPSPRTSSEAAPPVPEPASPAVDANAQAPKETPLPSARASSEAAPPVPGPASPAVDAPDGPSQRRPSAAPTVPPQAEPPTKQPGEHRAAGGVKPRPRPSETATTTPSPPEPQRATPPQAPATGPKMAAKRDPPKPARSRSGRGKSTKDAESAPQPPAGKAASAETASAPTKARKTRSRKAAPATDETPSADVPQLRRTRFFKDDE